VFKCFVSNGVEARLNLQLVRKIGKCLCCCLRSSLRARIMAYSSAVYIATEFGSRLVIM